MSSHGDLQVKDFFNGNAREFIRDRLLRSDACIKENSYDNFGLEIETASHTLTFFLFLYKFYFRVEVHGIENLPDDGPGLLVSNHSPILPYDATMLVTAGLVEPEKPRLVRTIVNKNISKIPYVSTMLYRSGQIIGCDENVRRIFENKNMVLVFPTGGEGEVHTIFEKYKVAEFTLGFMEYALKYNTPIIPTCVTGAEEAALVLASVDLPLAGFKHIPISPLWPWFGLLGLLPFPSKFDIYFDPPEDYHTGHAADADDPAAVRRLSDEVRDKVQTMLDRALGR